MSGGKRPKRGKGGGGPRVVTAKQIDKLLHSILVGMDDIREGVVDAGMLLEPADKKDLPALRARLWKVLAAFDSAVFDAGCELRDEMTEIEQDALDGRDDAPTCDTCGTTGDWDHGRVVRGGGEQFFVCDECAEKHEKQKGAGR